MLKTSADLFTKHPAFRQVTFRSFSTSLVRSNDEKLQSFRTVEDNPSNQIKSHVGQLYSVTPQEKRVLFQHGGLPKRFEVQTKTFNETCLMIRDPPIDVFNCLKHVDYTRPAVKFVLYGPKGTGKSLSLAHILHYGHKNEFLLVHVPWVGNFMRRPKDTSPGETEGFIDLNLDAASWLLHFKTQNSDLLKRDGLKLSRDVEWSKREKTLKDSNLLDLIDHGINRVRFASKCINVLAEEIKLLSNSNKCKVMVAIDGANAFFYPKTRVFTEKKEMVGPQRVTFTEGFMSLMKGDWNNGVVVLTVDELCVEEKDQISHYPRYLLGKQGFEFLDPFIPIKVDTLSVKEHQSILNYYRERKWIQPYPGQDDELYLLSGGNPWILMNLCNSL